MSRNPLETRALFALYRNHPDTHPGDRYGRRAKANARARRDMLLAWAATKDDYFLMSRRNLGATSLAWIRANQLTADISATGYASEVVEGWPRNVSSRFSGPVHVLAFDRDDFDGLPVFEADLPEGPILGDEIRTEVGLFRVVSRTWSDMSLRLEVRRVWGTPR